jgi:DNA-binding response OmpR family regulator
MRVLLVEDSQRLRRAIALGLKRAGYAVDVSGDGEEGLWFAESHDYDAIVLDLMLPGLNGLSILRRLRDQGRQVPVLILTARDSIEDRVRGLQTGADDYLIKPFAFEELLARVQTLVRRGHGQKNPRIRIADLAIDTATRTVSRGDETLTLTPRDYALLELLTMRRGQLVTHVQIEQHIYDARVEPNSNVVEAAVYALRHKIDRPGAPSLIQTRRGMGYILQEPTPCDPSDAT